MIPKPLYEALPVIYAIGAAICLVLNDSMLRFFPAALLMASALLVIYLRYEFRHLPAKEQAKRLAERHRMQRL